MRIVTLRHAVSRVDHAEFSPDGSRILTMPDATVARIWLVRPLEFAIERKPRELTPDERDLYEIGDLEERAEYRRQWQAKYYEAP